MRPAPLLLVALAAGSVAPSHLIYSGPSQHRWIALTFDAGADRGYAAAILTTLEHAHVRATFGMTGRWARQNRDLVQRMARDHDAFINHTYDHRSFTGLSTQLPPLTVQERTWEIERADAVVRAITGRSMKPYFRPPYGDIDPAGESLAGRLGYSETIMWTADSLGWKGVSTELIVQRCTRLARPGAIILMHVGSQSLDGIALPEVLARYRQAGYRMVTIPRLLAGH
jgi:peptidoglycan/xylan/chitin deacetylase (PgdA/CDA1 family)